MRTWGRWMAAGLGALALLGVGGGRSSAQVPGDTVPGDSIRPIPLDSVVVEVLRTPVQLDDAPFSISVLDRRSLVRGKSGQSLAEALQGLPGIQVQNRYNYALGERVSIRGFGARAQFGVRGVQVVVDGIPATLPDGQSTLGHVEITSLGRVEALRGPASALWGNAAGGVLLFQTRPAPPAPFRQEARVVLGENGLRRYQATGGGRSGDTEYLVTLARLGWDGFRTNPVVPGLYGGATRHHLNGSLATGLAGGTLRLTVNGLDTDAQNPGSVSDSVFGLGDRRAHAFNVVQKTGEEVRQGQIGVTWKGTAGRLGLETAAWGIRRSLDNPIPPAIIDLERRAGGVRGIVSSPEGPGLLSWSAGAEVELQRDDRQNFENDGGSRGATTLDQDEEVTGLGVFGQAGLELSERIRVTGGVRYDRVRFQVRDRLPGNDPDDSGERTLDAWSPSLGIHLEALPRNHANEVSLWTNVSTFFETPTTTELANRPDGAGGFNPELAPQTGVTVEAGVRGRTGSDATFELVGFHTELDDELVPFQVQGAPGRSFFRNAGSSDRTGIEAVAWTPLGRYLTAQLSYTWVKARFREFAVEGQDFSGNRIPGLAPHRAEALVTARGDGWFAEVRAEYTDAIPANDANSASTDAHWLADLRLGTSATRWAGFSLEPYAGITNLFDETYSASLTVNAFGGRYFEPGPGRSFYAGVRAGFEP